MSTSIYDIAGKSCRVRVHKTVSERRHPGVCSLSPHTPRHRAANATNKARRQAYLRASRRLLAGNSEVNTLAGNARTSVSLNWPTKVHPFGILTKT
jgi:hypothetical protein